MNIGETGGNATLQYCVFMVEVLAKGVLLMEVVEPGDHVETAVEPGLPR